MAQFLLQPLQALQFGDGRAPGEGGAFRSVLSPRPSTVLGAFRTALAANSGVLHRLVAGDDDCVDPVIGGRKDSGSLTIRGPLLVAERSGRRQLWAPCPADFELFSGDQAPALHPLMPVALEPGDGMMGIDDTRPATVPMALAAAPEAKPGDRPRHVPWDWLMDWLAWKPGSAAPASPADGDVVARRHGEKVRLVNRFLQQHVTMQPGRTAEDGGLFAAERAEVADAAGVAWWVDIDGLEPHAPPRTLTLGGQQGLASVVPMSPPLQQTVPGALPSEVEQAIAKSGGYLRILVLTPAVLSSGSVPTAGLGGGEVRGACVPGYEPLSGSRLLDRGRAEPRPARRAVPPGSVFVVKYRSSEDAVAQARALWFGNLCDEANDRKSGLGLVVAGGFPFASRMDDAWARLVRSQNGGNDVVGQ